MEEDALKFATRAHGNQQRKYTEEAYVEHLKRVAETVKTVPHTPEMVSAAYLHDVVEDTPVTIEEVREIFGEKIGNLSPPQPTNAKDKRGGTPGPDEP